MNNEIKQGVTNRFFVALERLIALRVLRGKQSFTSRYNIHRWNLNNLQAGKGTINCVPLDWLIFLVKDYHVSADWLLLGVGDMFTKNRPESLGAENH